MKINNYFLILLCILLTISCEDYLDKAPELDITEKDVFSTFNTFQGYLEEAYQCIEDVTLCSYAEMNWDFGDEFITTKGQFLNPQFDNGNYWAWQSAATSIFKGNVNTVTNDAKGTKGYWDNGWYGIRTVNTALMHLDDLVSPTQEERNLIEGQSLFFRGYLHFEILRSWGGVAYIDTVYSPKDVIREPRLSYLKTAMKINEDLKRAVDLLPYDWEQTTVGQTTMGYNKNRITKLAALGYMGKNLLYAASPLMNGVETGNYVYNEELCKQAAIPLWELIKNASQGGVALMEWGNYSDNFYNNRNVPAICKETIFNNPIYLLSKRWDFGDFHFTGMGGWGTYSSPTENYVEYFGMANGLDIKQPDSGYDPNNPWVNRDPRFNYNIIVDGDRIIKNHVNADTYAQFYVGGRHRNTSNVISGYGYKKYKRIDFNSYDKGWSNNSWEVPTMRFADIYLMYAEAVNEAFGPNGSTPGGITAVQAINVIRNRAGLPNVDSRYAASKDVFREFVRRERAVELAFESHRWFDLRRWYVAHLPQYREKYKLEFDKGHTYFTKVLHVTRVFDPKHYWLPFPTDQVNLYPEFSQNPGW